MRSANTRATRKDYFELSNLATNRKLYNMYLDMYIRACKKDIKKIAATTATV